MNIEDYKSAAKKLNEFTRWSYEQRGYNPCRAVIDFLMDVQLAVQKLVIASQPKPKFKNRGMAIKNKEELIDLLDHKGESVIGKLPIYKPKIKK